ncbi:hypothetical protein [Pseudoduganella sp.]|uniref:hypothetical protein n=1 Tax=Pseudoduganella sp. TaxID=1880898 RepID=UPI0035B431FF
MDKNDIVASAQVPGWPAVYVIGSFDDRITFFSQQVRGFSLAYALKELNLLEDARQVAVIGAGAAGLSLASGLALLIPDLCIDVFEREEFPLHLQRGCVKRNLHPHIYDWPHDISKNLDAGLPYLDWVAGSADAVSRKVLEQFEILKTHFGGRLNFAALQEVRKIASAGASDYVVTSYNTQTKKRRQKTFNAVFLTIGFGGENVLKGADSQSYWSDRGTPDSPRYSNDETNFLISGSGDGALIDLCASAIQDFDHSWLIDTVTNWPGLDGLKSILLNIDAEAEKHGKDFDFRSAYDARLKRELAKTGLIDEVAMRLRKRANIYFNTQRPRPLEQPTATLNRFLAYIVLSAAESTGKPIQHVVGTLTAARGKCGVYRVNGASICASQLFVRHGAAKLKAFKFFELISQAYQESHSKWLDAEPSRRRPPRLLDEVKRAIDNSLKVHRVPISLNTTVNAGLIQANWTIAQALAANAAWLNQAFCNRTQASIFLRQPLCPGDPSGPVAPRDRDELREQVIYAVRTLEAGHFIALTGLEGNGKSWIAAQTWMSLSPKPLTLFITAEIIGAMGSDLKGFLASQFAEQTGYPGNAEHVKYWTNLLQEWTAEKRTVAPGLLVVLDGLNQRQREDWAKHIDWVCSELATFGGKLIVTTRDHFFTAHVKPKIVSKCVKIPVPQWSPEERNEILAERGIDAAQLQGPVAEALRNPRLLGIALSLLSEQQLRDLEELSVSRLLFEHISVSQRDNFGDGSPFEFRQRLSRCATEVIARLTQRELDDFALFDGGLKAVIDGRYLIPVQGEPCRYAVSDDGLVLALGFAIVQALLKALRNNRDLVEALSVLTEPIAELDKTPEAVLAALTIACVDGEIPTEVGSVLLGEFASMQNPDERSFGPFSALVRDRPSVFLGVAENLALQQFRPINYDWIREALHFAKADAKTWSDIAQMIKRWLSYFPSGIEHKVQLGGLADHEVAAQRTKLAQELVSKIENLEVPERAIYEKLVQTAAKEISGLSQLAIELLAGKPLQQFSDALVQWSFGVSLNGSYASPTKEFTQLLCFNPHDWAETRSALLQSMASLRTSCLSKIGKWTQVTILRATGDVIDAKHAETLYDELVPDKPPFGKWRLVERYCSTDPCDPVQSEPLNVAQTVAAYAQIDVSKVSTMMGKGEADFFFDAARAAVARYAPEVAIDRQRSLASNVLDRTGLPLRQGIVNLLDNASLITNEQAIAFASRLQGGDDDKRILSSLGGDEAIWTIFHMEVIFPMLNADTQFALLSARWATNKMSDRLLEMIKPMDSAMFEEQLDAAMLEESSDALTVVLLFSPFNESPLSVRTRNRLPSLLSNTSVWVRAFTMRMIALSRDTESLRAAVENVAAENHGSSWVDRLELRYTSAVMCAAAIRGIRNWRFLASRLEFVHLCELASHLGSDVASFASDVLNRVISRGLELKLESSNLEVNVRQEYELGLQPQSVSLSLREKPAEDSDEAFYRALKEPDDFDEKQNSLIDAYSHMCESLDSQNASDFLEQFSLNSLASVVPANLTTAKRWAKLFTDPSNREKLAPLRNVGLLIARELAAHEPTIARELFRTLEPIRPLVNVTFGHENLDLAAISVWSAKDSGTLDPDRAERLEGAKNNDELVREVWAALWGGREETLRRYIDAQFRSQHPAIQARGIFISGLMNQNDYSDQVLRRFSDVPGLLGRTASDALEFYQRNLWAQHWYDLMRNAANPEEFWRAGVLFLKVTDGRIALLKHSTSPSDVYNLHWRGFERQLSNRFKRVQDKRRKKLFADDVPSSTFLIRQ